MSLEDRIERLEKQNRRLRAAVLVVGAGLALAVGMGALNETDIITIADGRGRVRLDFHAHPAWGPKISLTDANGMERVRIGSDDNAQGKPFIIFFAPDGRTIVKRME